MQPKRDPSDRRFWTADRPGSLKHTASPVWLGRKREATKRALSVLTNPIVDSLLPPMNSSKTSSLRPGGRTPEQARIRSRDVYNALLDLIEAKINNGNELSASEIAQLAGVTGRIGVPAQLDAKVTAQPLLSNDERNALLSNILADLASRTTLGEGTARQLIASQSDAAEPPVDASVDVSEDT